MGKNESTILARAIGQVVASNSTSHTDELWVAVPNTASFASAGERIMQSRVFAKTGIRIALVGTPMARCSSSIECVRRGSGWDGISSMTGQGAFKTPLAIPPSFSGFALVYPRRSDC